MVRKLYKGVQIEAVGLIHDRIRQLRPLFEVPLVVY